MTPAPTNLPHHSENDYVRIKERLVFVGIDDWYPDLNSNLFIAIILSDDMIANKYCY